MSADNGVYVLQTSDGFRVAHAQAIENIFEYNPPNFSENLDPEMAREYFKGSSVYSSYEAAMEHAVKVLRRVPVCEYGVQFIDCHKQEFPKD